MLTVSRLNNCIYINALHRGDTCFVGASRHVHACCPEPNAFDILIFGFVLNDL